MFGGRGASPVGLALGGRTTSGGVLGGIALVVGIVGLAIGGRHPGAAAYLDPIAQGALGIALIIFGAALAHTYMRIAAAMDPEAGTTGTMTGTTADMFLGGAVIILGVLALLRVEATTLVTIQVILVGVGLLLNSAASIRAVMLELNVGGDASMVRKINEELVFATASARAMAGVAVGILGIISLSGGSDALTMTLAAAIVGGGALLLDSATLSSRVSGVVSGPKAAGIA